MDKELHRIASTCIIYKNDPFFAKGFSEAKKYLLLQRSFEKKAFPGKWTVPGGGLSIDDYINTPKTTSEHWYFSVENSLRREVKEEAGIEVRDLKYLCDMTFIRSDNIPVVILSFYAPYLSGEVKLDSDSINSAWVTYEEAKNYDMVDGLLEEILMVDKIIKGENIDSVKYSTS